MNDVRHALAQHMKANGFLFNVPEDEALRALRQRIGDDRFAELAALDAGERSALDQEKAYSLIRGVVEGNLYRSVESGTALATWYSLYQQSAPYLIRQARVLELGSWTGTLAAFIAARHPDCCVIGVDGARDMVDACKAHYHLPNLKFEHWNYRWAKPPGLEPADVLLCAFGVAHQLPETHELSPPDHVRRSREYIRQRDQARGYFSMWRTAAKEGARLFAIFRLFMFPRFLAWLDAAQQSGWAPRLNRVWHVEGEERAFPGLVFEAVPSPPLPLDEGEVLDRWTWFTTRHEVYARLYTAPALAAYRSLDTRRVLGGRQYVQNGKLTQDEVGRHGMLGYVFTWDVHDRYRLLFVSQKKADELAAGLALAGSSDPITDDGAFQRSSSASFGNSTIVSPFASGTFDLSDDK